jgi:hypothetical protein
MSSRQAPWIKRIELQTGELSVLPLDPAKPLVTARRTSGSREAKDRFEFDGQSWFHVAHRWAAPWLDEEGADDDGLDPGEPVVDRRWAMHGTTASSGSALYTFMEFPEARHPQLEASLATDPATIPVYADWLEEQGDPYAASLKPELLKERGPAGNWFLEGLDRSGLIEFTIRDALVREVKLGGVPDDVLAETMHRLCHLRACVALEHVSMERPESAPRRGTTGARASSPLWRLCRFPPSVRRVTPTAEAVARPFPFAGA